MGVNPENGHKLVVSLIFIAVVVVLSSVLKGGIGLLLRRPDHRSVRAKFWSRQALNLLSAAVMILGLLSIWFSDPARAATVFGLISAGLAFALQQVITSIAGYIVILRGSTFNVGDRITMGGVRGDVLRLGFIQTTIMEMGEPPAMQGAAPDMWIRSRQFTGRIVTVTNSKIFEEPVYNYTRDFPFIWEEMVLPISYTADRAAVETMLLDAARRHGVNPDTMAAEAKHRLQDKFGVEPIDLEPRVFFRITDNWLELTVRFLAPTHGIRNVKDAMSREIVVGLEKAGIGIASSTYDIVGFPPIEIRNMPAPAPAPALPCSGAGRAGVTSLLDGAEGNCGLAGPVLKFRGHHLGSEAVRAISSPRCAAGLAVEVRSGVWRPVAGMGAGLPRDTCYPSLTLRFGAGGMEIHKPKAAHSWREFAVEIGTIVCGIRYSARARTGGRLVALASRSRQGT